MMEKSKFNRMDPAEVLGKYEKIKSPEELAAFLRENNEYGFIAPDGRVCATGEEIDEAWEEYALQSPRETIQSGYGVCWDVTELERDWFAKNGYEHKTVFMMFDEEDRGLPTHTYLAFKKDGKWYWFEHSLATIGAFTSMAVWKSWKKT
jgi:hypothetical protein